jgi:hypothetical protein
VPALYLNASVSPLSSMTTLSSRWLARILAPLMIIGALIAASIGFAGTASAADNQNICQLSNTSGFSDPTCGPSYFSSSGGGGGSIRICAVTAAAHSQWGGFLGTLYEDSRANVCRSGADAANPFLQTVTTFYSSALSGFHGCAQTRAYDAYGHLLLDSGQKRVGVDGGSSYTLTSTAHLSPSMANSITSLSVTQWQC